MVDILAAVPLSAAGIISTLINAVIASIAIIIVSKLMKQSLGAKRAFLIAIISLFIIPVIFALIAEAVVLPGFVIAYIIPLIVWILLGEILLSGEGMMNKLKIIIIAFVIYIILSIFLAPTIFSFIPF